MTQLFDDSTKIEISKSVAARGRALFDLSSLATATVIQKIRKVDVCPRATRTYTHIGGLKEDLLNSDDFFSKFKSNKQIDITFEARSWYSAGVSYPC